MTAPDIEFVWIPATQTRNSMNTPGQRLELVGSGTVDTSTPLDLGSVNISGGAINSDIRCFLVRVATWNDGTTVKNFRFWCTSQGFDSANTDLFMTTQRLDDQLGEADWVPDIGDKKSIYAHWQEVSGADPGAQNVLAANQEATSWTSDSGAAGAPTYEDTSEAVGLYIGVGSDETTGTYEGDTGGFELLYRFQFDYS